MTTKVPSDREGPGRDGGLALAAALFHGLSDPSRLAILQHLTLGEHRVRDLTEHLGLAQSTVSAHLACLRDCGIVRGHPQGRQTRYEIADPHLTAALTALVDVTLAVDESAPCLDPACSVPGCCDTEATAG